MANHDSAALSGGIPWDQLIEFANEKKAEEERTRQPAQLSKQQIAAISQLIELVHDIEVEDHWVSDLNQYCQQNKITVPKFPPAETWNENVYGTVIPRSRVYCILPSKNNEQFPKEGYGFQAGQEVPSFKKAQKAKNFAAMQAYKFLRGVEPSPRGSKRPASMTQDSPAHTRVKAEEDNSDGGVSMAGPSHSSGRKKGQINASVSRAITHGPTIRERVASLGGRLGYGIPEYDIEQDGDADDTWKGRPNFRNDGRIPEDMGVVSGIVGRQQAEDLVAEKVLEWLEKEEQFKKEQIANIMDTISS
ncbi:hypothetical protein NW762_002591 [Fusarium torreyae]|uniref:DRBM domain-containing protein n=1 Tax=Fusarium torreyae TaxID=1237075 RepID=A0A9W8SBJ1_9HYPO|nr:hypothetical protein NW762_002591 [Fusarium torreyae]